MKILFLIPSLKGGGQERAGMALCNYLLQYHAVTAVCFEAAQPGEYPYRCPVIRLPIATAKGLLRKGVAGARRISALKKLKNQLRPDVSIAFGNTAIILNALAAGGEKKIASIRQSFSVIRKDRSLVGRLHTQLYRWALKKAAFIIPVSNAINRELKDYFGLVNMRFINNGINVDAVATLASQNVEKLPGNRQWLVHSGRFDRSKGQWHLVKIFALVHKVLPDTGLIFLGNTDDDAPGSLSISQYCKDFLTAENISWATDLSTPAVVLFTGHVSNPFNVIRQGSLFVFPSLWEGFPNALLEAMSCGIPVVAANCATGPADILAHVSDSFGILLPAFTDDFPARVDSSELELLWSKTIISLLDNPVERDHFAQQSLTRVKDFSEERAGEQWSAVLQECTAK